MYIDFILYKIMQNYHVKKIIYIYTDIDPLCKGSTADFGSVSWGSIPYGSVTVILDFVKSS